MTQDSNQNVWSAGSRTSAIKSANDTFKKYNLSIFGIQDTAFKINDDQSVSAGEYLMIGAYAQFTRKMDMVGQITGQSRLELISESFLGREPTRGVCASRVCKAITGQPDCSGVLDITLFDNGC